MHPRLLLCLAICSLFPGLRLPAQVPGGLGGTAHGETYADAPEAVARYQDPRWQLVWQDEFEQPGAPDPAKWHYEYGRVRNREAQYYTRDRRENARVVDGLLLITAHREAWQGADYTSASLTTDGRFAFTYGKVEVRARVPGGRGTWPAIWTLGQRRGEVRWPDCGEIDIMEFVGFDPERFHFTVHTAAYNHTRGTQRGTTREVAEATSGFHTFGILWSPELIEWFCDGEKVFEYRNEGTGLAAWPFDDPQYLILNLAIGGAWGGQKGIDDTVFPARFEVDYVRVWQDPRR
jgi:beta-glucanase (GH16 family)